MDEYIKSGEATEETFKIKRFKNIRRSGVFFVFLGLAIFLYAKYFLWEVGYVIGIPILILGLILLFFAVLNTQKSELPGPGGKEYHDSLKKSFGFSLKTIPILILLVIGAYFALAVLDSLLLFAVIVIAIFSILIYDRFLGYKMMYSGTKYTMNQSLSRKTRDGGFLILVLFIAVVAGTYFYYQASQVEKVGVVSKQQLSIGETLDNLEWYLYKDRFYDIEFLLPKEFEIKFKRVNSPEPSGIDGTDNGLDLVYAPNGDDGVTFKLEVNWIKPDSLDDSYANCGVEEVGDCPHRTYRDIVDEILDGEDILGFEFPSTYSTNTGPWVSYHGMREHSILLYRPDEGMIIIISGTVDGIDNDSADGIAFSDKMKKIVQKIAGSIVIENFSSKTYRNEKYGFELIYPTDSNNLAVSEESLDSIWACYGSFQQGLPEGGSCLRIQIFDSNLDIDKWIDDYNKSDCSGQYCYAKIIENSKTIIDGHDAYKLIGTTAIGLESNFIILPTEDWSAVIEYSPYDDNHSQIVNSFKIIE